MDIIKTKAIYKHFKGDYYFVEDIAIHSETDEKMVIYRALYGDCKLFVRPYDSFVAELSPEQNTTQPHRFELQHIESVKK